MIAGTDYVPLISLPIEWEWGLMKTGQILAICILLLILNCAGRCMTSR